MSRVDIDAYLARISYTGGREPNLQTLQGMHRAHFFSVPFENLDIHTGRTIEVDEAVNFDKIVNRRRGGFCLELTGLFVRALRQLGFHVDILAARVMRDGSLGQPFSHMTSLVHLDEPWIADVGFGGRIAMPLRLNDRSPQVAGDRGHVLDHDGDHWFLTAYEAGTDPAVYVFTLQPRQFEEFHGVCRWLQTSPDSHFMYAPLATLATERGRVTLSGDRLITFENGELSEQELPIAEAQLHALNGQFGIVLPGDTAFESPRERV